MELKSNEYQIECTPYGEYYAFLTDYHQCCTYGETAEEALETLSDIADEFFEFIEGAELVIHNAAFDIGFINNEFALLGQSDRSDVTEHCTVLDTLVMARERHPGQRNNLDALCKRYGVDNSGRDLHGALLDAEILAEVYLAMTGGQTNLSLAGDGGDAGGGFVSVTKISRLAADRAPY